MSSLTGPMSLQLISHGPCEPTSQLRGRVKPWTDIFLLLAFLQGYPYFSESSSNSSSREEASTLINCLANDTVFMWMLYSKLLEEVKRQY